MVIDCDSCAVRGLRCGECVVSVLLGSPGAQHVDAAERLALDVLADSGLVPRLQLVPLGMPRVRDAGSPDDGAGPTALPA